MHHRTKRDATRSKASLVALAQRWDRFAKEYKKAWRGGVAYSKEEEKEEEEEEEEEEKKEVEEEEERRRRMRRWRTTTSTIKRRNIESE